MSNRSLRRTLDPLVVELKTRSMTRMLARLRDAQACGALVTGARAPAEARPAVRALRVPSR